MEIRRRKRKWDTLGAGGHSWDGTYFLGVGLRLEGRYLPFPNVLSVIRLTLQYTG